MRPILLMVILVSCGCSGEQRPAVAPQSETVIPDYSLEAFGGQLRGTNRGEWIGELSFKAADSTIDHLLNENVLGLVKNSEGLFAFTGLAHMHTNEGYIYAISRTPEGRIAASRLVRLPGAPSRVNQPEPGGPTSFLVFSGFSKDRRLFECYQLVGKIVTRGSACLPPE
jgi:hypothetical protein